MTGWGDVDLISQEAINRFEKAKGNVHYMGYGNATFAEYEHVHRSGGDKYLRAFNMENRMTFSPIFSMYPPLSELYLNHEVLILHYAIAGVSAYSNWFPVWSEERMKVFPNHRTMESKHNLYGKNEKKY